MKRLNENSTVLSNVLLPIVLRWLGGEVDKSEKKKKQTPSSLYSSVHFLVVNQLVSLTALLPLSLFSPRSPSVASCPLDFL